MNIPLSSPDISEADIEAVVAVLRSSRLSLGPQMEEFERMIAGYVGVDHAIAVSSGTSGLHLCIRALGIGDGDEVIVPSFTFIAAANAIRYERAMPVFADIEPAMLNIDPVRIEKAITARTRAILVVHTFGCPAEMDQILDIARRHKLLVIEDACEAIGAKYRGHRVGAFGDAAVFAFYPNKQITTGEGGTIVTRDGQLAARMRALRNQGRYESNDWLQHQELGYNYRISEINCALGISQFARINSILRLRQEAARKYNERLKDRAYLTPPDIDPPHRKMSWFVYVVQLSTDFNSSHRNQIMQKLLADGIGCARYFAPIHRQPAYAAWRDKPGLAITESVSGRVLALPFFGRISDEEVERVCGRLHEAVDSVTPR